MARERRERRLQNEEFARKQKAYEELSLKEAVVHAVDVLGWVNVTQHNLEPLVSHSSDASLKDSSFLPGESMVDIAMRLITPVLEIMHSQLSQSFAEKRSAFQNQIDDLDTYRNGDIKKTAIPSYNRLRKKLSLYRSFDFEDLTEFFAVAILHPLSHGHKGNLLEYLQFFKNDKKHTVLIFLIFSVVMSHSQFRESKNSLVIHGNRFKAAHGCLSRCDWIAIMETACDFVQNNVTPGIAASVDETFPYARHRAELVKYLKRKPKRTLIFFLSILTGRIWVASVPPLSSLPIHWITTTLGFRRCR